jgi:hypothetical protein
VFYKTFALAQSIDGLLFLNAEEIIFEFMEFPCDSGKYSNRKRLFPNMSFLDFI